MPLCVCVRTGYEIRFPGGEEELCKAKSEKKTHVLSCLFFAFRKQIDYPA